MMDQAIMNFVATATTIQKGVFLMCTGIGFVFLIQIIFYAMVKIWPKAKPEADEND